MPIKVKIYNQTGEAAGEIELSDKIFGVKTKEALVHQAVIAQLANQRTVIAHTKTKAEVRGGGRKPWKQKGTGRARAGSNRSPLWSGGGVIFGPRSDRNFKQKINKKMKQKAIFMALSDKAANGNLIVMEKFGLDEYKTRKFNQILSAVENKVLFPDGKKKKDKRSCLILNASQDKLTNISARNLDGVEVLHTDNLNIVDLLKQKYLVASQEAIKKIEETYKK